MTYTPDVVQNQDVYGCGGVVWPGIEALIPIFEGGVFGFQWRLLVFQVSGVFSTDPRYLELVNDTSFLVNQFKLNDFLKNDDI